ncbi:DNA recombination protein RmuC [Paraferrimonas sedimenticola]|uniref:DNA recombination protein RmuC n=1 Tax=Paraferrimonas sedimenticola TaxID=375674 RepID=A0AA37W0T1_9GAMM|nr:DNA recombination protein RmuC [Paraferrimonas sedimenticola]GLP96475.1 hypothetical protein GCM10007895_17810 [Paraferrimonas sedimenticola]
MNWMSLVESFYWLPLLPIALFLGYLWGNRGQSRAEQASQQWQGQLQSVNENNHRMAQQLTDLQSEFIELNGLYQAANTKLAIQKAQLEQTQTTQAKQQEQLGQQFENLANRLLSHSQQEFSRQSQAQVKHLLSPLQQQLSDFKAQLQQSHTHQVKDQSALRQQIESLKSLNLQMSEDAVNLTRALKGDSRQQGDWGEMLLSRILEDSGLREGHEYQTQGHFKNDAGQSLRPDVIVHLPNDKQVVIDSKVSLTAYERYYNCDETSRAELELKAHIESIRMHIKGLSKKNYQQLLGLKSLDYVLMFIPLEPAFLLALEKDPSLVKNAYDNNIMLVSPTNLMLALRTIDNLWRYQRQEQHAEQIARQAGKLYDKFCAYIEDMEKLGRALDSAKKTFDGARSKLHQGRGNLVRQAEQMRQMGVQSSKQLPNDLVEQAENTEVTENTNNENTAGRVQSLESSPN